MDHETHKFAALLRGVNVSGTNKLPMADLRAVATALGWTDVQSYIASGNLVFSAQGTSDNLANALRRALAEQMDIDVPIIVLSANAIQSLVNNCPYTDAGNRIHLFVCETQPNLDTDLQNTLIAADEHITVQDTFVWFHAPSGVARSKLFAKFERVLNSSATARNLNTLTKLAAMLNNS